MRTSVYVDALVLLGIHLLYWPLDTVAASGGALDSTPAFQTGAASASSHSKVAAFSATLTDGLAQAVAHESSKFAESHSRFVCMCVRARVFCVCFTCAN